MSSPVSLYDSNGIEVFRGTQVGGGGSQPLSESIGGAGANPVADGALANAAVQHVGGGSLLDYTDPTAPTVIAAGLYAITAEAVCFDGTQVGGNWNATVTLLGSVVLTEAATDGPLSGGAGGIANPRITVTALGPLAAGDAIIFPMSNFRGAAGNLNLGVTTATLVKLA